MPSPTTESRRDPGVCGLHGLLPWVMLAETGMTSVDARRHRAGECVRQIASLPPQTWVSIVDDRRFSRIRLRRLARRAGLVIERELIVMPSLLAPAAVVEDTEWAVTAYLRTVAPGSLWPPRARTVLATVPLRILRRLPWSWTGLLASQRVVLARRG